MNWLVEYMPWLLSVITIYQIKMAGDKRTAAWLVLTSNQALWLIWIICSGTWGLVPMNICLWIVGIRNYRKWAREEKE